MAEEVEGDGLSDGGRPDGDPGRVISTPVEGEVAEHHMICNGPDGDGEGGHAFSIMAPKAYGRPQPVECPWCEGAASLKATGTAEVDTQHNQKK